MNEFLRQPSIDMRAPSVTPQTPDHEMDAIRTAQAVEAAWWDGQPDMGSEDDIAREIADGRAVNIPDVGEGYKISANVKPEFRVLETNAATVLRLIGSRWQERMTARGGDDEKVFLVISSLARTVDYQRELIAKGYPAVENSTHTKLGAFDIAIKWFQDNRPELVAELESVLDDLVAQGLVNAIPEPTVGAYHIAYNRLRESADA